jgi:hypothetical protein
MKGLINSTCHPLGRSRWAGGVMGVSLLCVSCGWVWPRRPAPLAAKARAATPSMAGTSFETTLRQAQGLIFRARLAAKRDLEKLQEWDPDGIDGRTADRYRQDLMARNPDTALARGEARRALALADSLKQCCRAVRLLAHIECDSGHHRAELQQARRLMVLAPREARSLMLLQHAAHCNGLKALEQQSERALQRLGAAP